MALSSCFSPASSLLVLLADPFLSLQSRHGGGRGCSTAFLLRSSSSWICARSSFTVLMLRVPVCPQHSSFFSRSLDASVPLPARHGAWTAHFTQLKMTSLSSSQMCPTQLMATPAFQLLGLKTAGLFFSLFLFCQPSSFGSAFQVYSQSDKLSPSFCSQLGWSHVLSPDLSLPDLLPFHSPPASWAPATSASWLPEIHRPTLAFALLLPLGSARRAPPAPHSVGQLPPPPPPPPARSAPSAPP